MLSEATKIFVKYGYKFFNSLKTLTHIAPVFQTLATSWQHCAGNCSTELKKGLSLILSYGQTDSRTDWHCLHIIYPLLQNENLNLKITDILNNVFRPQKALKKRRIKLYDTLALPVLLYGSETWTIKAKDTRRITAAEMKYMRRTAGYIWTD
jgi:hypothetical protein